MVLGFGKKSARSSRKKTVRRPVKRIKRPVKRRSSRRTSARRSSRAVKRTSRRSSRSGKKAFGGYAISFSGRTETLEQVFGKGEVTPSEMTKQIWKFVKAKKLSNR